MTTLADTLTRPASLDEIRTELRRRHRLEDNKALEEILHAAKLTDAQRRQTEQQARSWIEEIRRETKTRIGGTADFLQEFKLSTVEGVALLCVAEALLRIPDAPTADDLIKDKLANIDWAAHDKRTGTLFANASVWGLMLTGSLLKEDEKKGLFAGVKSLVSRAGQPVIRTAVKQAMGLLGDQFVLGRNIGEALENGAHQQQKNGYRLSYDMLGEGARTREDAARYFKAYEDAIVAIGKSIESKGGDIWDAPGISVKLSAIHPRFTESQRAQCLPELVDKLTTLAQAAAKAHIPLTVDAEESERLELWLDVVAAVLTSPVCDTWAGFGVAVQAYQKRAPQILDYLATLCRQGQRRMMVRLVKGAYWDSEVKRAQMGGMSDYPVYTRKMATDASYLACARRLFAEAGRIYPAFGSHNAYTLASILAIAPAGAKFEVQRLQGMGAELHDQLVKQGIPSRIYAPVGGHQDLLAYLVRRILENGANSSFVQRLRDPDVPVAALLHDPEVELMSFAARRNSAIPLPADIFRLEGRKNSSGVDLDALNVTAPLLTEIAKFPLPAAVPDATLEQVDAALAKAVAAQPLWADLGVNERAKVLEKAADLIEANRSEFIALIGQEAGRVIKNAVSEVREAVDLCRYYAICARRDMQPVALPGYTGERNELMLVPRGIVAAISPWNFPLAIFVGQIAAALLAGNAVMAKPAEQTPRIAKRCVGLLHQAGVPEGVLALLPGKGEVVGAKLVSDARVNCVVFTGSTEVGRIINQQLSLRPGPIIPLIAETGGLNAMIVDSTALPEQVCDDVLLSAFDSAGQRCSSLRVLFVQDDIADKVIHMITGALADLRVGNPLLLETDIGPVIDVEAKQQLDAHLARMQVEGKILYAGKAPEAGTFMAPHVVEISHLGLLQREAFGPILHIIRWQRDELDAVVKSIIESGYGLTGGIHSRREGFVRELAARLPIGNLYINRNIVGAIPGVQPFGGEGLSGTGPKAGGPHYVRRFTNERVVTTDTTAAGGNASLLMLAD